MYLSDRDIKNLLTEIRFETEDPQNPFSPIEQIQPASVDLRLDAVFWKQRSTKLIDLRRAQLLELSPRHHWSKIVLGWGESITLHPGEMLLGRTFEIFTVPPSLSGKLEGRSSFARLGIGVHCTADYINPGWRGRMPIELFNFGKSPIRLFPRIPICQVMFVSLSSTPELTYGARELSSKYMNDDGGPSYWWRDKRIKDLHKALGENDVSERVQTELLELMGPKDPDMIERFERLIRSLHTGELTNSHDVLERFSQQEDRNRLLAQVLKGICVGFFPLLFATSLGSLFSQPFGWKSYGWLHYLLWAITLLAIPVSVIGLRRDIGEYFGQSELEEASRKKP